MRTTWGPKRGRTAWLWVAGLTAVLMAAVVWVADAADHRDGPIFVNTAANGRQDLNDIYIFRSPRDAANAANFGNTVIITTISPFAGVLTPTTFDPRLYFDVKVDNNGDGIEDFTLRTTFSAPDANGVQDVTLRGLPAIKFPNGGILARGKTGDNIPIAGGGMFRAANHDDPFFFDSGAFTTLISNGLSTFPRPPGQAHNFFGPNSNLLAVILEVPTPFLLSAPSNPKIGVWMRSEVNGVQLDRMGRPAINTALIPPVPRNDLGRGERRNAFNAALPRNDRRDFRADMIAVLTSPSFIFKRTATDAAGLADFLLPDILTVDLSLAFNAAGNGYPNGRRLRDDVIDITLNLLSNGVVTTDNVDDDNGTRITDGNMGTVAAFPYIGPPNNPPSGPNP
jgi:hypothetical protein